MIPRPTAGGASRMDTPGIRQQVDGLGTAEAGLKVKAQGGAGHGPACRRGLRQGVG